MRRGKKRIDARRIGVAGFSAGGYTSLLVVGAVPRFRRFIDYCQRYPGDALCADAARMTAEAASHGRTIEQVMDDLQQDFTHWGEPKDPRVKSRLRVWRRSVWCSMRPARPRSSSRYFSTTARTTTSSGRRRTAEHLRPLIKHLAGVKQIANADHWVFLSPCSPELASAQAAICSDPPGVDRAEAHTQIQADALVFFRKTLNVVAH